MILIIRDNSVKEINKAILAIKDEIEALKRDVKSLKDKK